MDWGVPAHREPRGEVERGCRCLGQCGSVTGLSLPCVSVASGHTRGTQLLQLRFGMDQEPGDAAGEVSSSVIVAMATAKLLRVPGSMEQLPRGMLAPEPPCWVWGEPQGAIPCPLTLTLAAATLRSSPGARPATPQSNHAGTGTGWGLRTVTACRLSPLHCHHRHLSAESGASTWLHVLGPGVVHGHRR